MKAKTSNFLERMINMIVWVPILLAIALWLTGVKYILINILVILFAVLCGQELGTMLKRKDRKLDLFLYPLLAALFPVLALVTLYLPNLEAYLLPVLTLTMLMIMTRQTFVLDETELDNSIIRVTGMIFALFYPGFFLSYMIKFASLPSTLYVHAFFFFLVMLNDGFAYFIGMAFGNMTKSQGFILVSPNKSLVGFIGGILASVFTAVFFYYFAPTAVLFNERTVHYAIFMGFICGFSTIAGDLFESTIKRSADVKDSGKFFRGRGGVLDSFDSLTYTAPIFYYFLYFA